MAGKGEQDPFVVTEKRLERALDILNNGGKRSYSGRKEIDEKDKAWHDRFVRRGLKRGHLWIWWENRKIKNDKNFIQVKDYEKPEGKVGFRFRSKKIDLKWHWKGLRNPIKFHEESLEEWLLKRQGNVKLRGKSKIIRYHLVKDVENQQKAWTARFVRKGLKRGHLRIWWENRKIKNDKNFIQVKDYEKPEGKVGFRFRSKKIDLKWHWKGLRNPIKFHEESLEEWLINKTIHHGKEMMKELS